MRGMNTLPAPLRFLAVCMAPVIGVSVLAACAGKNGQHECLTTSVLSPVYGGSPTHKGVVVTVPRLDNQAVGLDVGFRTATGQWNDSDPIPGSFLTQSGQRVIVGIWSGPVQFRFAEVFSSDGGNHQALGRVGLSAQTTEQAQPWPAVRNEGVLPAWPTEPTTLPAC
jgi:hypothetical protein